MSQTSDIEGQELSTIIHVDVIRYAIFEDSLPQCYQCSLGAGIVCNMESGKNTASCIQKCCQIRSVDVSILVLYHDIKGMVISNPPLIAFDILINSADKRSAAVIVGFMSLTSQHLDTFRHLVVESAVKSGIAWNVGV